jgi:tetratricopeptide (TPR) repeat protein
MTESVPIERRVGPLAVGLLVVSLACLVALGITLPSNQMRAFETSLRANTTQANRDAFQATLTRAVRLYPSEPLLALLAAAESLHFRDVKAGRWLNRAMELAPGWAAPHHLAFQWLWQRGRIGQALLELRLAAEVDPELVKDHACRLGRVQPDWALTAAPRGKNRKLYLELVAGCVYPLDQRVAAFDEVLLREFPESALAHERTAWRLHLEGETERSLATIDELVRMNPQFMRIHAMRARILLANGRNREVIDAADAVLPRLPLTERAELLGLYAQAAAQMGSEDMAVAALKELRRAVGTDVNGLAASYAAEGRVQLQLQNPGEAFRAFREAYRINQDTRYLSEVARLAETLRDRPQALWAYVQLCQREPRGGGCAKRDQLLGVRQPERAR